MTCAECGRPLPEDPPIDLCSLACYVKRFGPGRPDDLDEIRSRAEKIAAAIILEQLNQYLPEPCCEYGPPGHSEQQHHDASPCYDPACPLDHPQGWTFTHPCDGPWRSLGRSEVRTAPCGACGAGYTVCRSADTACCPTCADNDTHTEIREKQPESEANHA